MPWKECHVMDERLRFVVRLLEGEKMAPLCAEFGISRKTGYKIFDRYKDCGVEAFSDRSHRAHRQANRLPAPIEATIVRLKREYPGWGAPKIREKLRQQFTGPHLPAISTVHAVLDRFHLVKHRRRRRPRATGTELSRPIVPNALWCADYKGEFMLGNRRYCYPLTITDFASRYLLTCEALLTTQEKFAFTVFERAFKEFGLPAVLLRVARLGPLDLDAEPEPPHREFAEPVERMTRGEGHAVVGPDRSWQTEFLKGALEHGEGELFLRRRESLAGQQVAAGEIGDRQRITVPPVAQHELALVIRAPQRVGLGRPGQRRGGRTGPSPPSMVDEVVAVEHGMNGADRR